MILVNCKLVYEMIVLYAVLTANCTWKTMNYDQITGQSRLHLIHQSNILIIPTALDDKSLSTEDISRMDAPEIEIRSYQLWHLK